MLLVSREFESVFTTQCDTFEQPRHVTGKYAHRLQTLGIPTDFIGGVAMHHIPVLRRNDGHIAVGHVFVHLVECRCASAAATGGYRCGRFAGEMVAIELVDEKYPVQKRGHRSTRRRVMDGRAEHETVVIVHHLHELIDPVVSEASPLAYAHPASDTPGYGLVPDPEQRGIDALVFQCCGNLRQGGTYAALLVRAAVY